MHLHIHWKPWGMTPSHELTNNFHDATVPFHTNLKTTFFIFIFYGTWKQLLQVESSLSLILYCFLIRTSIKNTTWRPNFQRVKLNFLINVKTNFASRVNPRLDCEQWNFTLWCTQKKKKIKTQKTFQHELYTFYNGL